LFIKTSEDDIYPHKKEDDDIEIRPTFLCCIDYGRNILKDPANYYITETLTRAVSQFLSIMIYLLKSQ